MIRLSTPHLGDNDRHEFMLYHGVDVSTFLGAIGYLLALLVVGTVVFHRVTSSD